MEVEADMRELARMKKEIKEIDAAEKQLRQRKKEFGWID